MRTDLLFIFPPWFYPHMPYSAQPILQAYLQEMGFNVHQVDLNLGAYQYLLKEEYLTQCYQNVRSSVSKGYISNRLELTSDDAMSYIINNVDQAISEVSGQQPGLPRGDSAQIILDLALDIISDSFYPSELSFAGLKMSYSHKSAEEVLAASQDSEQNMFIDYYQKVLPNVLNVYAPSLIAITISVPDQIIPAFTLCKILKSLESNIRIEIGGSVIIRLEHFFKKDDNLLKTLYDICIFGEGEMPLLALLIKDKDITCLDQYNTPDQSNQYVKQDLLPCPNYSELPLNEYLDREIILPILASRKCYWGKCHYCSISSSYFPKYRKCSARKIVDDIQELILKHNVHFFKFVDDAASPALLKGIAKELLKRELDVRWEAYVIFEEEFANRETCENLYKSGCRWLYFGLETADHMLAQNMNKQPLKCHPDDVLNTVKSAGINTHIWLIIGYPTDRPYRIDVTRKFIERNRHCIDSVEVNQFALTLNSPMMRDNIIDKYGIKPIYRPNEDIAMTYDFNINEGMSQKEAKFFTEEFRKYLGDDMRYINAVRSTKLLSKRFNASKSTEILT